MATRKGTQQHPCRFFCLMFLGLRFVFSVLSLSLPIPPSLASLPFPSIPLFVSLSPVPLPLSVLLVLFAYHVFLLPFYVCLLFICTLIFFYLPLCEKKEKGGLLEESGRQGRSGRRCRSGNHHQHLLYNFSTNKNRVELY